MYLSSNFYFIQDWLKINGSSLLKILCLFFLYFWPFRRKFECLYNLLKFLKILMIANLYIEEIIYKYLLIFLLTPGKYGTVLNIWRANWKPNSLLRVCKFITQTILLWLCPMNEKKEVVEIYCHTHFEKISHIYKDELILCSS